MKKPTKETYSELQRAYDYFNKHLFEGELPQCLITLQRNNNAEGYFSAERFANKDGEKTDEIAMNPEYFAINSIEQVLSTLGHEMVHMWQYHFGKPGRGNYHNKEWANKMSFIGLTPSSTGMPGGKRTGDEMCDYITKGGTFEKLCKRLVTEKFRISWHDRFPPFDSYLFSVIPEDRVYPDIEAMGEDFSPLNSPVRSKDIKAMDIQPKQTTGSRSGVRRKYRCPECQTQVWGKEGLNLICGDCQLQFEEV